MKLQELGFVVKTIIDRHHLTHEAVAGLASIPITSLNMFLRGERLFKQDSDNWQRLYKFLKEKFPENLKGEGAVLVAFHKGRSLQAFARSVKEEMPVLHPAEPLIEGSIESKALGYALSLIRRDSFRTREEMAEAVGLEPITIQNLEYGVHFPSPRKPTFQSLLAVYSVLPAFSTYGAILQAYSAGNSLTNLAQEMETQRQKDRNERHVLRKNSPDAVAFGKAIHKARTKARLTPELLGMLAQINHTFVAAVESGAVDFRSDDPELLKLFRSIQKRDPAAFAPFEKLFSALAIGRDVAPLLQALGFKSGSSASSPRLYARVIRGSEKAVALGGIFLRILTETDKRIDDVARETGMLKSTIKGISLGTVVWPPKDPAFIKIMTYLETVCAGSYQRRKGIFQAYCRGQDLTPFVEAWKKEKEESRSVQRLPSGSPEARAVGRAFEKMREATGLTQRAVALENDVAETSISAIERARTSFSATMPLFERLCAFYQKTFPKAYSAHQGAIAAYRKGEPLTAFIAVAEKEKPQPVKVDRTQIMPGSFGARAIGAAFFNMRKALGLTQKEVVFAMGRKQQITLSSIETGAKPPLPSTPFFIELLAYYEKACPAAFKANKGILLALRDGGELKPFIDAWTGGDTQQAAADKVKFELLATHQKLLCSRRLSKMAGQVETASSFTPQGQGQSLLSMPVVSKESAPAFADLSLEAKPRNLVPHTNLTASFTASIGESQFYAAVAHAAEIKRKEALSIMKDEVAKISLLAQENKSSPSVLALEEKKESCPQDGPTRRVLAYRSLNKTPRRS